MHHEVEASIIGMEMQQKEDQASSNIYFIKHTIT